MGGRRGGGGGGGAIWIPVVEDRNAERSARKLKKTQPNLPALQRLLHDTILHFLAQCVLLNQLSQDIRGSLAWGLARGEIGTQESGFALAWGTEGRLLYIY